MLFFRFGKRFITQNKMSPDAFLQMAIVYGYYGLYGDVVAAYEPVLTKVSDGAVTVRVLCGGISIPISIYLYMYIYHSMELTFIQAKKIQVFTVISASSTPTPRTTSFRRVCTYSSMMYHITPSFFFCG